MGENNNNNYLLALLIFTDKCTYITFLLLLLKWGGVYIESCKAKSTNMIVGRQPVYIDFFEDV